MNATKHSTASRAPLLTVDLDARRCAVGSYGDDASVAPLAPLADSLTRDLVPLLSRALPIPAQKARLTRIGGRCPIHGTLLDFDPWSPHAHRCERCDTDYVAREHDDWWAMGAQLWTVERAVHAAALYALRGDVAHATLAASILGTIADRYERWPNRDNVLGPSRPFFSTYLESIWLLNACHALTLLEAAHAPDVHALGQHVRAKLVTPSVALIASYHEGLSNRQVWNEVAILSALRVLGENAAFEARVESPNGFLELLRSGLLNDGSWYEGENYHLFAHRGLWYGVELLKATGRTLNAELERRYCAGFVAPFVGVLPDDTFPSRRDSQYAVSIRQWRIAEWCELGYAHTRDPRIAGVLTRIYATGANDPAASRNAIARARSTADAERNAPPSWLTRADLSWRALLMADVAPAPAEPWRIASGYLPAQGLAVVRRDAARDYVALEGGHGGGGHGHPDRLALTLQTGDDRWLEDPGAGSYVDRSLHWYRSTLAHAAPLVDGASQRPAPCTLLAFEDRGGAGWMWKRTELTAGVTVDRTVVVADGYLVDLLEWRRNSPPDTASSIAPEAVPLQLSLPIAGRASVHPTPAWSATAVAGAGGLEDGFDFAQDVEQSALTGTVVLKAQSSRAHASPDASPIYNATAWYASREHGLLFRANVPGAPGHGTAQRHWLQVAGDDGCIAGVWSWHERESSPIVTDVAFNFEQAPVIVVTTADGTRAEHRRALHGWHVDLHARHARSSIDLEGLQTTDADSDANDRSASASPVPSERVLLVTDPPTLATAKNAVGEPDARIDYDIPGTPIPGAWRRVLHEPHYVGTEQRWDEAERPTATIQIAAIDNEFILDVHARTGPVVCSLMPRENPLDNERNDVNADGLQLYFRQPDASQWTYALLVVPSHPTEPRISMLTGATTPSRSVERDALPSIRWCVTSDGWAMRLVWQRSQLPIDASDAMGFDLILNERPLDHDRRRGQLVLSGGGGFGYLRGDRQDPTRALRVEFARKQKAT